MSIARCALALLWLAGALVAPRAADAREALRSPLEACEYVNVFPIWESVDPDPRFGELEPVRRVYLQTAIEVLPSVGLRAVADREQAYWLLSASSLVGPGGSFGVFVELTAGIELQRHLYVAELEDPGFAYRGNVGGNYYLEPHPEWSPQVVWGEVFTAVSRLWALEFEQVAALCAISDRLKQEGWQGLEELRIELAAEVERVRRERAQRKGLELEVEDSPDRAPAP